MLMLCFLCVVGELQELCMSSKQVKCLCLCLSVCVCVLCLCLCVCGCHVFVYVCMHVQVCVHVCISVHLYVCVSVSVYMCMHMCVLYMTHCYHIGWLLIMLVNRCHLWCYSTLWVSCIQHCDCHVEQKHCVLSIHSIVSLTHVSKDFTIYSNIIYTISTCIMLHHHHCFVRLCGAVLSSVAASNDDYHWTTNE